MKERGYLVRTELAGKLREIIPSLQQAFDPLFDDIAVDSDELCSLTFRDDYGINIGCRTKPSHEQ